MAVRLNITVDEEVAEFVALNAQGNRSAFINKLLKRAKYLLFEEQLKRACAEEANDADYQAELALWEVCTADGLLKGLIDA